ncbi:dihydrolipoyl dehydrogenase [Sandaracinus amylolyticus]|uniref:Dihydrolipoyl dehydrogenase n=1 Tax=Sandaracinus amylolyticus TaxID=927083 RepID=A0A0F6W6L0_9BACT|nr:dihydrolipoyl dehydrogenase [Sandaracinus amylolyticus]AKF08736.1 Dihydrolipoamide dehydrogenase [Sandaracinus amylolyticus]
MANKSFDAIVIGGGPGGYPCAIRLGQLKQKVLVVEKEYVGGVCLNWGCIPSKALIAASGLYERILHAEKMGITAQGVQIDIGKMQDWKEGIVKKLTSGVATLIKANGGEIVMGTARVTGPKTVEVTKSDGTKETFEATKAIVVATGATPIELPHLKIDGETVITARQAVSMREAKGTMIVVGGGVIGMELGMVYQKLGMKVIVVELLDQLLGATDPDLVQVVQKAFEKAGGEVLLKTKATNLRVENKKAMLTVELPDGAKRDIEADKVLVSIGFRPNGKGIGLEEIGVKLDQRGHVLVDDKLQTNVKGVYAIGDVSGAPYLAHKATKEGEIVAEVIAGKKSARDWRTMPSAIFTEPEIATTGMSERDAKAAGKKVKLGKFPFSVLGRAMAIDSTEGFVKVILDEQTNEVLGVAIVGPEASDLISEASLAIEMCAFAEDVAMTIHPHPTLGEGVMEAFHQALGHAIHTNNRAPRPSV